MIQLLIIVAVILLFYVAIPVAGAFAVRGEWRKFRRRLLDASLLPEVPYTARNDSDEEVTAGVFRAFGTLEALQGQDRIWIRTRTRSVAVDMAGVKVYLLSSSLYSGSEVDETRPGSSISDESPTIVKWERVTTLPEGSGVFVAGRLLVRSGRPVFVAAADAPLTVVFFDGRPSTFLDRAIWSARQRNEYWNQLTPGSIAAGSLTLMILAYIFAQGAPISLPAIVAVTASAVPLLPFLPPGVGLYFLYRNLWHRGRFLRAQRDILRLPLRYFAGSEAVRALLPNGAVYRRRPVSDPEALELAKAGAACYTNPIRSEQAETFAIAFGEERGAELVRPDDPLAGFAVYAGSPESMALQCSRRARLLEVLSGIALFIGLFGNWYLAILVISTLLP